MKTHAELVKEFTEESKGIKVPTRPMPMSEDSVRFLAKMMMSEIVEMIESVMPKEQAYALAHDLLQEDMKEKGLIHIRTPEQKTTITQIEEQMDAMVDCWYYALDSAAKHGMNLEPVFQKVHMANMAKRDPQTGTFIRREDGKVIKPADWKPADIESEVKRQLEHGSW